jgi:GT2 family glycosyltransferase
MVSILILTHNRKAISARCIKHAIQNVGEAEVEFLIWDNASTDGTYAWLKELAESEKLVTRVFQSSYNYGTEAINFLAEKASGEYIIKLDDDALVPANFVRRLVYAYKNCGEDRLMYLGYDMRWGGKTFATRHGLHMYKPPIGKITKLDNGDTVYILTQPAEWMVNGVCRLSRTDMFLKDGRHPKGMIYGEDPIVCMNVAVRGYRTAFLHSTEHVLHLDDHDAAGTRQLKNAIMNKQGISPHV